MRAGNLRLANLFSRRIAETRRRVVSVRKSAQTRLVWFVAISGYVLFNAKPLWETLIGVALTRRAFLALSIPWVAVATLSLLAHIVYDIVTTRENRYCSTILVYIDRHTSDLVMGVADMKKYSRILKDEEPPLPSQKASLTRWNLVATWVERLAILSLIFSFVWSILWPIRIAVIPK